MGKLYEKIEEEEINSKEIRLPEYFPAIYVDENDTVYCYYGVLDKDRFLLESYPYWLKGTKPIEAKKFIKGYFRIENGIVLEDKEFIDEKAYFNKELKCKKIPAVFMLPGTNNNPYGIYYQKSKEIEELLTQKIFGLSYKDLSELIYHFNNHFKIVIQNYYSKYPYITRAIKNDNYCDMTDMWIPAGFPYIAFAESGFYYSHISLYGFYEQVKFMTQNYIESSVSEKLIENGLSPKILENLFKIENYYYKSRPINHSLLMELKNIE